MKRQRNSQQIKEQDKCPPNQTKEEEIGNLPDKEFGDGQGGLVGCGSWGCKESDMTE